MKSKINILIACEESQSICMDFRKLGFNSYSCDILPPSGGHPEYHLQKDVREVLKEKWDLVIAHPPCTYLTVTGNRWFNVERYGEQAIQRQKYKEEAIEFFMIFANLDCKYVAIENPVGVMSTLWRKPDQIIQPYQFGDPYEKRTCLWLKGLPKLIPTNVVEPPKRTFYKSGKSMPSWFCECAKLPKEERSIARSKTFPGISQAISSQYGEFILNELSKN